VLRCWHNRTFGQRWRPFVKWSCWCPCQDADVSEGASVLSRWGNPLHSSPSIQVLGSLSNQQVAIELANFKKPRFLVVYFLSQWNQ